MRFLKGIGRHLLVAQKYGYFLIFKESFFKIKNETFSSLLFKINLTLV
jgi:hypothetical protein